jgi:hypothetical protein
MFIKFFTVVAGLLILTLATGCAGNRVNLVDQGKLTVQRSPSAGSLPTPQVWAEGNELVVYGSASRRAAGLNGPNCVRVVVLSPDGSELEAKETRVTHTRGIGGGGRGARRGLNLTRYSVRFAQVPPAGSVVRVEECREKQAASDDAAADRLS